MSGELSIVDHTNKVEIIGHYGGDETHALSAWTSTSRELTAKKRERIPSLLKMLADNYHDTPFEKSMLHFLVTTDIATHIHILKHRIGVSPNGESARYKELKEDKSYIPQDWPEEWSRALEEHTKSGQRLYHAALEALTPVLGRKRAKESTRFFLGYNTQITMDVSFNWRSFAHFYGLRGKEAAQTEVREVAESMMQLVVGTGNFTHTIAAFKGRLGL